MECKIKVKFSKSHHFSGKVTVDRPDSVFRASVFDNFIISSIIDRKILNLPGVYRIPLGFDDSGNYAIPAKYAIAFLDSLVEMTMGSPKKYPEDYPAYTFYISKNEYTALLERLEANKHLTLTQATSYSRRIRVIYDIDDMIYDAETNSDADLALELVQDYKYKQVKDTSSQLHWLNKAKHFNSSHPFFANPENIAECLKGIESANILTLFKEGDSATWLLDAIAACPTFKRLDFDTDFYPDCLNKTFVEFLTKPSSISELKMGSEWANDFHDILMTSKHAQVLANALRLNKTVKRLDVLNQLIGDEGLTAIIDALIANPETKLKNLCVVDCNITEQGAAYLLNNIDKIPSLRYLNLQGNSCDGSTLYQIELVLQQRRATSYSTASVVERQFDTAPTTRTISSVVTVGMFIPSASTPAEENTIYSCFYSG